MSKKQKNEFEFMVDTMNSYLDRSDWRTQENANSSYSIGGLIMHTSGAMTARYWLDYLYPEHVSREHKNAAMHIHDLSMLAVYCCGWSLRQLIQEGLGGVEGKIASAPARHLNTLMQQMVNFLGIMQNEAAGAMAFSSFDTYLAPFIKADNMSDKEIRQCLQTFLFGVNTPSRWSQMSPFVNVTIDWICPDDLRDMPAIVGGEYQEFTYGDCQPEMDRINRIFMEEFVKGDANGRGFLYPIPTYNITKNFDWKHPNCELLFKMTSKYGVPYFQNYINSDLNPSDVRSMCCFDGSQKVLVRRTKSGVVEATLEELWNNRYNSTDINYHVFHNGHWVRGKIIQLPGKQLYKVVTSNKKNLLITEDHLNPTMRGDIRADELTTTDYLMMNTRASQTYPEVDKGLNYEDGFFLGMYLGDGSMGTGGDCDTEYSVALSLNEDKYTSHKTKIEEAVRQIDPSANVCLGKQYNNVYPVSIHSRRVVGFIREYVEGVYAHDKRLNLSVLIQSEEFRRGIVDGYYATDGGNSNRIYTTSEGLVDDMEALFTSLGMQTVIDISDRTDEPVIIRDKVYTRNYPLYCIRWYSPSNKRNYPVLYKTKLNSTYFKISSIEKIYSIPEYVYCFEMENEEEPYFTLPNGVITHNCRLSLDKRELRKRGGGLFGADEFTGSIGVVTINMPQIAYLTKTLHDGEEGAFLNRLLELMEAAKDSLEIKRKVITEQLNNGLYPYIKRYLPNGFGNHFSTIGLVGMNEACLNLLGKGIASDEGTKFAERVLDYMRSILIRFQEETGNLYNLEATPAESTSYRLAMHDKRNFPEIITAGEDAPYYTNSTQLPVDHTANVFDALDQQEALQTKYTGGTVFHVLLGEAIPHWESCRELVKTICTNYKIPYVSISPTYSVCVDHGYLNGAQSICPTCGKEAEVFSRIVGYYRPEKLWNAGKKSEAKQRKKFNVPELK